MQTATLKRHADLMDRMANTLGIDLEEEALRGDLPFDEIAEAVFRCTSCAGAGDCQSWLKSHEAGSEETPNYCQNSDLFKTLR